ncbi:MAG: hypothetical protein QXV32_06400 [Conexivisphaerales archaeon]
MQPELPADDDHEYTVITEGETSLLVPRASLSSASPSKKPVFFNPRGKLVRDISILAYRAMKKPNAIYGEALTGAGARLVRVANEVKGIERAYGNDLNVEGLRIARLSARLNGREALVELSNKNADLFLTEKDERFDIIDVDPFGSPVRFVEDALKAVKFGGMLSVTATDTAALKGLYNDVAFRRYFGTSARCDFSTELGLRLLASMVIRKGMQLDLAAKVVFAHSDQHYMRVYFVIEKGIENANTMMNGIGYVRYCRLCYFRKELTLDSWDEAKLCPRCGMSTTIAGPVWVGEIFDRNLVSNMMQAAEEKWSKRYLKMLNRAYEELPSPPYYYSIPDIADRLGKKAISPSEIVQKLIAFGYKATLTAIDSQAVRTDAPVWAVEDALSQA